MVESTKKMINEWKDFQGRADRSEFWWGYLGMFLLELVISIIPCILMVFAIAADDSVILWILMGLSFLVYTPLSIFMAIAVLSAEIRRFRDAGFPWWVIFASFIPTVGWIAIVVFLCFPTSETPIINFGNETPKTAPAPAPAPASTPAAPVVDVTPEEAPVVEETPVSTSWVCPNCGAESEGKFCGACGTAKPE